MNREEQVIALLAERRKQVFIPRALRHDLTAAEIAQALGAEVESVRSAIKRLHRRGGILRRAEQHEYTVCNATAKHIRYRYFVA